MPGATSWKDSAVVAAFIAGIFGLGTLGVSFIDSSADRTIAQNKRVIEISVAAEQAYLNTARSNCATAVDFLKDESPNRQFSKEQQVILFDDIHRGLSSCAVERGISPLLLESSLSGERQEMKSDGGSSGGGGSNSGH